MRRGMVAPVTHAKVSTRAEAGAAETDLHDGGVPGHCPAAGCTRRKRVGDQGPPLVGADAMPPRSGRGPATGWSMRAGSLRGRTARLPGPGSGRRSTGSNCALSYGDRHRQVAVRSNMRVGQRLMEVQPPGDGGGIPRSGDRRWPPRRRSTRSRGVASQAAAMRSSTWPR